MIPKGDMFVTDKLVKSNNIFKITFHQHDMYDTPLTGLVWPVDSSSNLTVADVMTLMMSSHVWPVRESAGNISLQLIHLFRKKKNESKAA